MAEAIKELIREYQDGNRPPGIHAQAIAITGSLVAAGT